MDSSLSRSSEASPDDLREAFKGPDISEFVVGISTSKVSSSSVRRSIACKLSMPRASKKSSPAERVEASLPKVLAARPRRVSRVVLMKDLSGEIRHGVGALYETFESGLDDR